MQLQAQTKLGTRALCARTGLPATSLRRWRRRAARGQPVLERPGPKKLGPLPLAEFQREVEALLHRRQRTRGTGALYAQHRQSISRRDLQRHVRAARQAQLARQRQSLRHVRWHQPNLAWAIDATEYGPDQHGRKLFLLAALDLATRHAFTPLVTLDPGGAQVAAWLRELFRRHGPPLLLKRDNGSIFHHQLVERLLAEEAVLPLNSPAYYPRYNGAIERHIRELKTSLSHCLPAPAPAHWQPTAIAPFAAAAAHLRNCTPRRSLRGQSAAQAYHQEPHARLTKRERHAAFQWIKNKAHAMLTKIEAPTRQAIATTWRLATQRWLQHNHLITITTHQPNNQPCVTPF
jgi:Integrase core domain